MDTLQQCSDTDAGGRHFLSKKMQVGCSKKWPSHFEALATPSLCIWGKSPKNCGTMLKGGFSFLQDSRRHNWKRRNLRWAGSNLPNSGAIRKKDYLLPTEHSLTKWSLPSFIEKLPHTTGNTQAPQPEVQENYFTTRAIFPLIPGCPAAPPLLPVAWMQWNSALCMFNTGLGW